METMTAPEKVGESFSLNEVLKDRIKSRYKRGNTIGMIVLRVTQDKKATYKYKTTFNQKFMDELGFVDSEVDRVNFFKGNEGYYIYKDTVSGEGLKLNEKFTTSNTDLGFKLCQAAGITNLIGNHVFKINEVKEVDLGGRLTRFISINNI